MAPGDVYAATDLTDVSYVDLDMYGTPEYGTVYLVDAEEPALVDTGMGTHLDYVERMLDEAGVGRDDPLHVLCTHVHLDHAGAAGHLVERYPNATVYVHEVGAPHLVDPTYLVKGTKAAVRDQWAFYEDPVPVPEDAIVELTDGDTVEFGERAFDVHHAPGHAPHQVVFHDPEDACVYVADAAGIYVPAIDAIEPTSPPSNFDLEQVVVDAEAVRDLDPDVLCYPHYGPAGGDSGGAGGPDAHGDADAYLEEYVETIQDWVADIEAAWERFGDEERVVDHLAEQRGMAEVWSERKAHAETRLNVAGVLHYLKSSGGD